MRGKISKDPILSKTSTRESPMQIVFDHSPPHRKITNTLENLTVEHREEIKETFNDTPEDLLDISNYMDETVAEYVDPNIALVTHRSTWIIGLVEHLWQEQRKRKRDQEEDNSAITL